MEEIATYFGVAHSKASGTAKRLRMMAQSVGNLAKQKGAKPPSKSLGHRSQTTTTLWANALDRARHTIAEGMSRWLKQRERTASMTS